MDKPVKVTTSKANITNAEPGDQIVYNTATGEHAVGLRYEEVVASVERAGQMPRLSALTMLLIGAYHRLRKEGMSSTQIRKMLIDAAESGFTKMEN